VDRNYVEKLEKPDAPASILSDTATQAELKSASSDELLFSIAVTLLMGEAPKPDLLRRRGAERSLWAPHTHSKHLGALFHEALRDDSTAAQAVMFMNAERVTWSVLVDHVRRLNLSPLGAEATVEDVIIWLAAEPNGIAALNEAVRLGLSDYSRSHTPEWLDEAWQYVTQKDVLQQAVLQANATNAARIAERFVQVADEEDILRMFRENQRIADAAQQVFFQRLKGSGRLVELVSQSTAMLSLSELCGLLDLSELYEAEKLLPHHEYSQRLVQKEIKKRV
jgi:hypothetical protein